MTPAEVSAAVAALTPADAALARRFLRHRGMVHLFGADALLMLDIEAAEAARCQA